MSSIDDRLLTVQSSSEAATTCINTQTQAQLDIVAWVVGYTMSNKIVGFNIVADAYVQHKYHSEWPHGLPSPFCLQTCSHGYREDAREYFPLQLGPRIRRL